MATLQAYLLSSILYLLSSDYWLLKNYFKGVNRWAFVFKKVLGLANYYG